MKQKRLISIVEKENGDIVYNWKEDPYRALGLVVQLAGLIKKEINEEMR